MSFKLGAVFLSLFCAVPAFAKLNADENSSMDSSSSSSESDSSLNMKRWFERINFDGYVAPGAIQTGSARTASGTNHGHFWVKEAQLDLTARPWENVVATLQWFPIPPTALNDFAGTFIGEANVNFKNVFTFDEGYVGFKAGRFDIAYGDEYTWQWAPQDPMITRGAAWLWGWGQGVEAYGKVWKINWITSVFNGDFTKSSTVAGDKSYNVKLLSDITKELNVSGSYMSTARTTLGSMFQGQEPFNPSVGSFNMGRLFEVAATYTWGNIGHLKGEFGRWYTMNQDNSAANAHLTYYLVEPLVNITDQLYAVARYSAIGTLNASQGAAINDGMSGTAGNIAGVSNFSRVGGGLGYKLNPSTTFKAEVSQDHFTMASGVAAVNNARNLIAAEAVVKF